MTISGVSVDCGWLMAQHFASHSENLNVMLAFEYMKRNGLSVLIDHAGNILAEYERNLEDNTFGKKLFAHVMKSKMYYAYDGSPTNACTACLDQDGFDQSDRPYIAVAQRGCGAFITHELKHHVPTRVEAIQAECSVLILDTHGFIALMR